MKILKNKAEMARLYELHNSLVKDWWRCGPNEFNAWIAREGHEDLAHNECYIEISRSITLSGHAEILDW